MLSSFLRSLGAIVTPDGSGITMWFVAGPMTLLYLVGMFTIERKTPNLV